MASKCLVLGGTGFLGSNVVLGLVERGYSVSVLARRRRTITGDGRIDAEIEFIERDFHDTDAFKEVLKGVDYVFHYVGTTLPVDSNEDPSSDLSSNVLGSIRLLEEAIRQDVRKVIFSSSGGTVYGIPQLIPIPEGHPTDPISAYGISKLAIEKYLELFRYLHGLDFTIFRYANPYGARQDPLGRQGVVSVFLGKIARKEPITVWGDGSIVRDFVYVKDAVEATLLTLERDHRERVFNVGTGRGTSIDEVIMAIRETTGEDLPVRYLPSRRIDVPVNVLDIARIRRELDWEPRTSLSDGIAETWERVREAL